MDTGFIKTEDQDENSLGNTSNLQWLLYNYRHIL